MMGGPSMRPLIYMHHAFCRSLPTVTGVLMAPPRSIVKSESTGECVRKVPIIYCGTGGF